MSAVRRSILVLAVTIGVVAGASLASAQVGEVQVKGKWWSGSGVGLAAANELKAKCKDVNGPQIYDASVLGERTITLNFHADCFIFNDTHEGPPPPTGDFVFTGEEIVVEKNGNPKPFRRFSGILTAPVFVAGSIQGALESVMKCGDPFNGSTCSIEKGTFTYSRYQPGPPETHKVFVGKFKAKYP